MLAGGAFNTLHSLIVALQIPLSGRHNALYDAHALIAALVFMCEKGASANRALKAMKELYKDERIPTGQWLLGMLAKIPHELVEECGQSMLARTAASMIKRGHIPASAAIAFDMHLHPFTGEDGGGWTVSGRPKGGTTRFDGYMTAYVAEKAHMPHVGAIRMVDGVKVADYVKQMFGELRRAGLKPRLFLADREFCTVAVMSAFDGAGEKFLMPARKTAGIRKALAEYKRRKRNKVSRYTMKADDGTEFTFWLVIEKRMVKAKGKRRWKYLTFTTNVRQGRIGRTMKRDIPGLYRQRWRIENAYKSIKQILPTTSSKNLSIRTFMMYFAMVYCNTWYASNHAADADAAESGRRPAKKRRALSEFATLMVKFALEIIRTDMGKRGYYLQCVT